MKLPKRVREEPQPPTAEHTLAILDTLGDKWRLLFVTIEQGALRLGEAVSLRWGDVDAAGLRLRLPRSATKRDQARWVLPADWLMEEVEKTCPLEDRAPNAAYSRGSPRHRLPGDDPGVQECEGAALPPHSLRHRRITSGISGYPGARARRTRRPLEALDVSLDVYCARHAAGRRPAEQLLPLLPGERR